MSDSKDLLFPSISQVDPTSHCEAHSECGHNHVTDSEPIEAPRNDGAGEPCPTPLVWQEVRENYLNESTPWEVVRGPHRILGRRWGSGAPLYFLNNFAATAELYSLLIWLLREDYCCVVYDAVTDNRQAARNSPSTMSGCAEDLFAAADHLGHASFQLFGAGFGGAVALQAALDQPQRIERLMLQHGFARRRLSFFERCLTAVCLRSGQTLDALPQRRRFQAVNHKSWFPPFDHSRFEFLINSTGTLLLRDLARRAQAIHKHNVVSRLHEITCPVMLLRTEGEGKMAAEAQALLESKMNHPQTQWMHSAGQHPCLTHPHRVAKIIRSFSQLPTA